MKPKAYSLCDPPTGMLVIFTIQDCIVMTLPMEMIKYSYQMLNNEMQVRKLYV